jgi:hypothetical protein
LKRTFERNTFCYGSKNFATNQTLFLDLPGPATLLERKEFLAGTRPRRRKINNIINYNSKMIFVKKKKQSSKLHFQTLSQMKRKNDEMLLNKTTTIANNGCNYKAIITTSTTNMQYAMSQHNLRQRLPTN